MAHTPYWHFTNAFLHTQHASHTHTHKSTDTCAHTHTRLPIRDTVHDMSHCRSLCNALWAGATPTCAQPHTSPSLSFSLSLFAGRAKGEWRSCYRGDVINRTWTGEWISNAAVSSCFPSLLYHSIIILVLGSPLEGQSLRRHSSNSHLFPSRSTKRVPFSCAPLPWSLEKPHTPGWWLPWKEGQEQDQVHDRRQSSLFSKQQLEEKNQRGDCATLERLKLCCTVHIKNKQTMITLDMLIARMAQSASRLWNHMWITKCKAKHGRTNPLCFVSDTRSVKIATGKCIGEPFQFSPRPFLFLYKSSRRKLSALENIIFQQNNLYLNPWTLLRIIVMYF